MFELTRLLMIATVGRFNICVVSYRQERSTLVPVSINESTSVLLSPWFNVVIRKDAKVSLFAGVDAKAALSSPSRP